MTDLTQHLTRLLEQAEKATPGPWEKNGQGAYVAMMSIHNDRIEKYVSAPQSGICLSEPDMDFIASSRTLVPALIKALLLAQETLCAIAEGEPGKGLGNVVISKKALSEISALMGMDVG